MHSKINIHNFWRSHIFIVLIFVIMSLLSGALMYHSHLIGTEWDLNFHWQRIYELRDSVFNGNLLPLVALNYFNQSGSAVMSMYPSVNLLPVVLLSFLIKSPIILFNITFIISNFARFLIAYFSSFNFNKDKNISFIFSTTYVLSITSLYYYFGVSAPGTLSVISYLPLVLFGFLSLLNDDQWIELSCGISLIIFSHILSIGITIVFLCILSIINIRLFSDLKKLKALIKSIVITLLITSIFWITFMIISINNHMNIPTSSEMKGTSLFQFFDSPFSIEISDTITLAGVIGLVLSCILYKKLSHYSKQLFWTAVLFLLTVSDLFPWNIAGHTLIRHLQFPHRLYIIPQIILCYLLAECLAIIMKRLKRQVIILVLVCLIPLSIQIFAQKKLSINYDAKSELINNNYNVTSVIKKDSDFNNVLNNKNGSMDYFPIVSITKSKNISGHLASYDDNLQMKVRSLGNGKFIFTNKKSIKKLSLPFLYYNNINYQVKLDGKTVKAYPNKNALMTINNVSKGNHHVQIIVHKTKAEIASYVLSFVGLVILLGAIIKGYVLKRKNK